MADFWLVRRGKGYNVYNLYKPHGLYWYTGGWNPRAIAAFAIGTVPQLPGLAYTIEPNIGGIARGYLAFASIAWLEGVVFSLVAYYLLYLAFPFPTLTDEEDKAKEFIVRGGASAGDASSSVSQGEEEEKLE